MDQERSELEAKLEALAERLTGLEDRLGQLERAPRRYGQDPLSSTAMDAAPGGLPATPAASESLPLIGRTLLVLGGAFVLRSITEGKLVGLGMGTALGIAYALTWLFFAERAAAAGATLSASFYGLSTAIIAFPLVWEGTVKFAVFTPNIAAGLLSLIAGIALALASRRKAASLAWMLTLGSVATALALALATKALVPFAACLVLLGLATLWLGDRHGALGLGWAVAAVADGMLLLMTAVLLVTGADARVAELMRTGALVGLLLALVVIYLGTLAFRSWSRRVDLTVPELSQGLAALLIGLGGADAVARRTGACATPIGVTGLSLAAGCYGVAFTFIDRQGGQRRNFIFYSTVALLLTLAAFSVLLPDAFLAPALALAGVVAGSVGAWRSRATLSLHGAVYATLAALVSGTVPGALRALTLPRVPDTAWITPSVWAVLAATAALCWLPVALHGRTWGRYSRAPKLVVLTLLALGTAGVLVTLTAALLPGASGSRADPGVLAVFRTAVLASSAGLLALVSRGRRLPETGWLVYPALIAGGLKLVLEDFRAGRPATLVLSLALYGGALILAPRLSRRPRIDSPPPALGAPAIRGAHESK